jgi:hypothetical protein
LRLYGKLPQKGKQEGILREKREFDRLIRTPFMLLLI